jgi:hypothetical protein
MLIEQNVPLPPPSTSTNGGRIAGRSKWGKIVSQMEVGDSVLVLFKGKPKPSAHTVARQRFVYHGKKLGHSYVSRKVDGGIRIWRTA